MTALKMHCGMRHLDWAGTWNARDLGGLRLAGGGLTPFGQLVRSESLHRLQRSGWEQVERYRIRTIIDMRDPEQRVQAPQSPPPSVATIELPLEGGLHQDAAFQRLMQSGWWATSLYLRAFLENWPERVAQVVSTIVRCPPGGVLFHCSKGSDRTGVVALAILSLLEVDADDIVADYEATASRLSVHMQPLICADDIRQLRCRLLER